jgi:hypothetical protein
MPNSKSSTNSLKENRCEDNAPHDLKTNRYVKVPIARIEKSPPRCKMGKPRKYTVVKMRNAINKYFDWCETEDRIPSISGLAIHLKLTRDAIYAYNNYVEFKDVIDQTRMRIVSWCEEDVYRTPGVLVPGKALYMKNVHNWAEKQQTDITQETTIKKVLSVEEARIKLNSMAPLLLEQLKGALLSQLSTTDTPKSIEHGTIIEGEIDG